MRSEDRRDGADGKVPELRWLRRVVTGLAVAMGAGVLAIAAVLWLRLSTPPVPVLPTAVKLPQGLTPEAVTFARDWTVVVTGDGEVLVYGRDGGLRQRLRIDG